MDQTMEKSNTVTHDRLLTSEEASEINYDDETRIYSLKFAIDHLYADYKKWLKTRLESIKEIRSMASELKVHKRNVDIARVTGTSIGAAATAAGVIFTGLALAPFTAGSSLFIGLGIGAGLVGVAGGATSIGAVITQNSIERQRWQGLKDIIDSDSKVTTSVRANIENYNKTLESLQSLIAEKETSALPKHILQAVKGAQTVTEKITLTVLKDVLRTAASVSSDTLQGGTKVALMSTRVLGGIGMVLGGISLIVDVVYLVEVGKSIQSNSPCELANKMEEIADIMQKELDEMMDYMGMITRDVSDDASISEFAATLTFDNTETENEEDGFNSGDFQTAFPPLPPDVVLDAVNSIESNSEYIISDNIRTQPDKRYYMITAISQDENDD